MHLSATTELNLQRGELRKLVKLVESEKYDVWVDYLAMVVGHWVGSTRVDCAKRLDLTGKCNIGRNGRPQGLYRRG